MNISTGVGLVFCALPAVASEACARDVTSLVVRHTDLDEKIAEVCRQHCKGNLRHGALRSVDVQAAGSSYYEVTVRADLVNKHNSGPILGVGGGAGWSYTVQVVASGTLDPRSCNLTIDRIRIINDKLGIARLARGEEGKIHNVSNCGRFL